MNTLVSSRTLTTPSLHIEALQVGLVSMSRPDPGSRTVSYPCSIIRLFIDSGLPKILKPRIDGAG
jgi:hypothetical protein